MLGDREAHAGAGDATVEFTAGDDGGEHAAVLGGLDDVFAVVGAVVGAIARAVGGLAAVAVVITAGRSHEGEAQQYGEKSQ